MAGISILGSGAVGTVVGNGLNQKQSPAQRMNYQYYRAMARWARRQEERLKRIEERLEEK